MVGLVLNEKFECVILGEGVVLFSRTSSSVKSLRRLGCWRRFDVVMAKETDDDSIGGDEIRLELGVIGEDPSICLYHSTLKSVNSD